jgi:hypothetical protein
MFASSVRIPMFTIKFETVKVRPRKKVVLRTSVNNWTDQGGQYAGGAWQFALDERQSPGGMEFKFVIKPNRWMLGNNLTIGPPAAGQVCSYTDKEVQFPPSVLERMSARLKAVFSRFKRISLVLIAVLIPGIGIIVGFSFLSSAQQQQVCGSAPPVESWKGIQISGLPSALQSSFGYGRGTQTIESTLNATAQTGMTLPSRVVVFTEPLVTSDGTKVIPSLSNGSRAPSPYGISAMATRIDSFVDVSA